MAAAAPAQEALPVVAPLEAQEAAPPTAQVAADETDDGTARVYFNESIRRSVSFEQEPSWLGSALPSWPGWPAPQSPEQTSDEIEVAAA